jgi:hypothetical protein
MLTQQRRAKKKEKKKVFVSAGKGSAYTALHSCVLVALVAILLLRSIFVVKRENTCAQSVQNGQ